MQDNIKYLYQKRLNEKLKEELERIENIYGNILEYSWSKGSTGKSRETKE